MAHRVRVQVAEPFLAVAHGEGCGGVVVGVWGSCSPGSGDVRQVRLAEPFSVVGAHPA